MSPRLSISLAFILGTTGLVSRAAAQPAPASAPDATALPGFAQLDRMSTVSSAGADLSYLSLDDDGAGDVFDVTVLRLDLHGQYISPVSRFGGYAQVPVSMVFGEGDDSQSIGNLELGGIYAPRLGNPDVGVILRGGVTLPTAGDDVEDFLVNGIAALARPTDLALAIPEGLSLRLGISPVIRNQGFFGRADVGIDLNINNSGNDTSDPILHYSVGAGYDFGIAAIAAELANVTILGDDGFGDSTVNMASVSGRVTQGQVHPFVAFLLPLDEDARETIDAVVALGVDASF